MIMYSHEIKELLEQKKGLITIKEYLDIIVSPQTEHIIFNGESYEASTDDSYTFKFRIIPYRK